MDASPSGASSFGNGLPRDAAADLRNGIGPGAGGFSFDAFTTDFSTYAGRYSDMDYSFASGRVHALEAALLDDLRTSRLTEARDLGEFGRLVAETGIRVGDDLEKALSDHFAQVCAELRDMCREKDYLDLFLLEADVHNLKLFLKHLSVFWPDPALAVSEAGAPESASGAGTGSTALPPTSREASLASVADQVAAPSTIDPQFLFDAIRDRDPDGIPRWMWQAASDAYAAYAHTGEGYRIDTVLDRACAVHGTGMAEALGNAWFLGLVRLRVDLADLGMLLRTRRGGFSRDYLASALLGCGTLRPEELLALAEQDDESLAAFFARTPYGSLLEGFLSPASAGGSDPDSPDRAGQGRNMAAPSGAAAFGKASDDFLMAYVRTAKRFAFGPESLVAHRFAKETEIRNLRIVLTFLRNALPVVEAQPLLRESHVP